MLVRSGELEPPRVLPHSDLNAERLAKYFQELKEFLRQDVHTYNCQSIRELTTIYPDLCHDVDQMCDNKYSLDTSLCKTLANHFG
jgi:hypothetical protein